MGSSDCARTVLVIVAALGVPRALEKSTEFFVNVCFVTVSLRPGHIWVASNSPAESYYLTGALMLKYLEARCAIRRNKLIVLEVEG